MEPDILTDEKFQVITGYSLDELKLLTSPKSYEVNTTKFRKEDFIKVIKRALFYKASPSVEYVIVVTCCYQNFHTSDEL